MMKQRTSTYRLIKTPNNYICKALLDRNDIKVPDLIYERVDKLEMPMEQELIVGGSHSIALTTPHFELRQLMFEKLIWPFADSLHDSQHLLCRGPTLMHSRINLSLRMPRTSYNDVFMVDAMNRPVVHFTFNQENIHLRELATSYAD